MIILAETNPSWRFVFTRPAHFLAFGFGAGLIRGAPGTAGTLVAFPLFWLLNPRLAPMLFLALIAVLFVLGIWICGKTGEDLGVDDHSGIVWDEIVAFLLVLDFAPTTLLWQALAFILFRAFDVLKPPPIDYFDKTVHGGFGVMLDDLMAAFYTLLCLAFWKTLIE
ncbi:MAG TPA: phosphatidylglycerophosphatase A [Burkholderiales bacterium]|nr:phosphatidylglycerophosphatase A [Burkholderiales bacterium]